MEFDFGNFSIFLPPIHITVIALIIIFLLIKWSKQLKERRYTIFFYFLISTYISPIYSQSTREGVFELWIPLGFIVIFFYLYRSERNHPAKMKASLLGLCIAVYKLIQEYGIFAI